MPNFKFVAIVGWKKSRRKVHGNPIVKALPLMMSLISYTLVGKTKNLWRQFVDSVYTKENLNRYCLCSQT